MQNSDIYPRLTDIFREVLNRDDLVLTSELSADDVEEWSSFKMIDILMAIEERFNIPLTTKDVHSLTCVGDLVAVIASKSGQR